MRWLAPIVIVALVVAGMSRPTEAARGPGQRSSMSSSAQHVAAALRDANRVATKVASRSGLASRGSIADRSHTDEVFIVPRAVGVVAIRAFSFLVLPAVLPPRSTVTPVDNVARGPPLLVVPSHPVP